jgi:hypothetical protein
MNRKIFGLSVMLMCLFLIGCATTRQIVPPTVTLRDIAHMARVAKGETAQTSEHTWIYIPEGYRVPDNGEVFLTVHFHDAVWFFVEEHWRRGARNPVLIYSGLVGSSAYKKPFDDPTLFRKLLDDVVVQLKQRGAPQNTHITGVEISSFSAGYGAVREILKVPEYVDLIHSIVLADSNFAGYVDAEKDRRPVPEHIATFIEFAKLAAVGKKLFVVAFSSVYPGTYASPRECAEAMMKAIGGRLKPVKPGSLPSAAPGLDYPLILRYDKGRLHVWGYGGNDPKAHMAQARALADFWRAVEKERR